MNNISKPGEVKPKTIIEGDGLWKGSIRNATIAINAIAAKYGEEEAQKYDPKGNCFTFKTWRSKGYTVKRGEHAICRIPNKVTKVTLVNGKRKEEEIFKHTSLFYYLQVTKLEDKQQIITA